MNRNTIKNTFTGMPVNTYTPAAFEKLKKHHVISDGSAQKIKDKYVCKHCKSPMGWVEGTNIMVCKNEQCQGLKVKDSKTGEFKTLPVYSKLLPWEEDILEREE